MKDQDFFEEVAKGFTGHTVFLQRGGETLELGKVLLGEVAAGGESAIYLYFGHPPVAAPYPLSRLWDRMQLQGALRMDFLKRGAASVVDMSVLPFPALKRVDEF